MLGYVFNIFLALFLLAQRIGRLSTRITFFFGNFFLVARTLTQNTQALIKRTISVVLHLVKKNYTRLSFAKLELDIGA